MNVRSLSVRTVTGPQLELLGFLAGERECPNSVRPSMYAALLGLGLIERAEASRRFYVTEVGHHELARLQAQAPRTPSAVTSRSRSDGECDIATPLGR